MTEPSQDTEPRQIPSGAEQNPLFAERGDFILPSEALPEPDIIVSTHSERKKVEFRADVLQDYLNFLELVVLNERLIVGYYNVFADLDSALKDSKAFSPLFTRYYLRGSLNLYEEMFKILMEREILFKVQLDPTESSPQAQVLKHLPLSDRLRSMLDENRDFSKDYEKDKDVVEALALASLALEVGMPLHLSEIAWRAQLPYLLTPQQISAVSSVERVELNLRKSVMTHLTERLNEGARRELNRIAELGVRTVFPETPIAGQIVMDSSSPEDFLLIALQLRDEYKTFRKEMIELEAELLSEDTSLKRKIRLQRHLDSLAAELWPNNQSGIWKEALELSNILSISPLDPLGVRGVAKLTKLILDKPSDLLLRLIRRRKVRVLLKTRKKFLESKGWPTKLAKVFQLPKRVVKDGLSLRD
jgi:hypothetical protein